MGKEHLGTKCIMFFLIIIIPRALPHYHVDVLLEYRNGIQRHYRYLMSYVTAKVSTNRVFLIIYIIDLFCCFECEMHYISSRHSHFNLGEKCSG